MDSCAFVSIRGYLNIAGMTTKEKGRPEAAFFNLSQTVD